MCGKENCTNNEQGNPYAKPLIAIFSFSALIVCILLYVSIMCMDEKSSPPPVQFFLTTFLALLVFDAIVFQILVSNRQWEVMDTQAGHMRDQWQAMQDGLTETRNMIAQTERHFQISERPILVVEKVKLDFTPGIPLKPTIRIWNRGRTAARKLDISVKITWDREADFTLDDAHHYPAPWIPANDFVNMLIEPPPPTRTKTCDVETHHAILDEKAFIFVFGEGTYEDLSGKVFPLERWADFYSVRAKKFITATDFEEVIEMAKVHNKSLDNDR